jgi:hypothetical protein
VRRREFIVGLGAAAWPVVARSQQQAVPVIGWLAQAPGTLERALPPFSRGLAEAGYVVGSDGATMYDGAMPYRCIVSDTQRAARIAVQDTSILDVDPLTNNDRLVVASHH